MSDLLRNRTYLHERHRLSHQQIDLWLGENRGKEFMQEKIGRFEAFKQFLSVTDTLAAHGIPFVCLKGPLLSLRIYGDPTVRYSHDIDLLIKPAQIEPVLTILEKTGYLLNDMKWPEEKKRQEMLIQTFHHLSFFCKQTKTCVEIHWALVPLLPVTNHTMARMIDEHLTEITVAGRTFTVLTKEFELLYLLIHGARHKWSRLKWLVDIKDYPVSDFNQDVFNTLANQLKAGRIIGQTNRLLMIFCHIQLPFPGNKFVPKILIQEVLRSIEADKRDYTFRALVRRLHYSGCLFTGVNYKIKAITNVLFQPADLFKIRSSCKLIYYLYRPFGFLSRIIKKKMHA